MAIQVSRLQRFFWGVISSFTFDSYELHQRNRIIFMNLVSYTGVFFMVAYSLVAFRAGNQALGYSTLISAVLVTITLIGMIVFRWFKLASWLITLDIAALFGYLAWSGGENGSGILWIQAFPLVAMFLINIRLGSLLSLSFMGFIAVILFVPQFNISGFTAAYSTRVLGTYGYVWLFGLVYGIMRGRTEGALTASNDQLSKTTAELSFEKKQTDGILKNVREGIFLLDKELNIGIAHSSHLGEIFEQPDLAGTSLLQILKPVLGERDFQATSDWLPMLFGSSVNPDLLAEINPLAEVRAVFFQADGSEKQKFLRFSFTKVQLDETESRMLAVVRDATDEILLQRQIEEDARKHQQNMEKLFQVIHVDPAMMAEFIVDTEAELDSINELLRDQSVPPAEIMPLMFQAVHGIKGNAALLGLNELARKVHGLEEQVRPFLETECSWKELLGLTLGLGMIQQELEEIRELIDKIVSFQTASDKHGLTDRGLLERTLNRLVDTESKRCGKPAKLVFHNFDSRQVPEHYRKLVKDVLVQLLRNSLAHGIEENEVRLSQGKPQTATISLGMSVDGDNLQISCRDDGRGLDLEAIRNKASSLPDLDGTKLATMRPAEIAQLIFRNGFSTATEVDLAAGRGAGMALVKSRVDAVGGTISLKSRVGQLCEISFRLPLQVPVAHATS